jgi:phosphatidylinositol glycan class B
MDLVREPTTISDRPPAVSKVVKPGEHVKKPGNYHKTVYEEQAKDFLKLLFGFRLINALLVATFFQPDEYFQALEPGWQIAFGSNSGAWITWVSRVS